MTKQILCTAAAMMAATVLAGCGASASDNSVSDPVILPVEGNDYRPIGLTRAQQQMVDGSNDFAFRLFREARTDEESLILSPLSITFALGMLNNGAGGATQSQICSVLGFKDTGAAGINDFCRKMLTEASQIDLLTKVSIANTIFLNKDYQLKPAFTELAKSCYDAEPQTRDFSDGKTLNVINQWAADHTGQMIKEVLNAGSFNPEAVSYLLNAIYFKGVWAEKFSKSETKDEAFEGADGKLPTMHLPEKEFLYGENDLCQSLRMPYGNGAYAMTILLPREGKSIGDVVKSLTADSWQEYRWMHETVYADVKLPRFSSKTDTSLVDIMEALGMTDAFDPAKAEFPDFCYRPTYIALMKQTARIDVSEEGTEAAAVTVIGVEATSIGPSPEPRHVKFHAVRPFLYVISEQSTGAIFFVGQFVGK